MVAGWSGLGKRPQRTDPTIVSSWALESFHECQESDFIFSFWVCFFCNSKNPCSTSAEQTTTSAGQSHERKVGNRRWRHWTKISAKSVTKKNPSLPSTFSSKMPPCEMFVYFRNFLKKHLVTPYSSNGSGLEDKNRSFSFFSLIEKNSKHISSSIFSRLKLWQRINRTKNWRLTKIS